MKIPLTTLVLHGSMRQPKLKVMGMLRIHKELHLNDPEIAAAFAARYLYCDRLAEEVVYMVGTNTAGVPIAVSEVSHGTADAAIIQPREIMIRAFKMGATGFFLFHNHCSGDPTPSESDVKVTRRLEKAGKLVGIPLLDHIVIGSGTYAVVQTNG